MQLRGFPRRFGSLANRESEPIYDGLPKKQKRPRRITGAPSFTDRGKFEFAVAHHPWRSCEGASSRVERCKGRPRQYLIGR